MQTPYVVIIGIVVLLLILSLVTLFHARGIARKQKREMGEMERLLREMVAPVEKESFLHRVLSLLERRLEGEFYAFYRFHQRSGNLVLEAVLNREEHMGPILPSYSGLIPSGKERYFPPRSIPTAGIEGKPALIKQGEVQILAIPVLQGSGLFAVGPKRKGKSAEYKAASTFSHTVTPFLSLYFELEKRREQVKLTSLSTTVLRETARLLEDPAFLTEKVMFAMERKEGGEKDMPPWVAHDLKRMHEAQEMTRLHGKKPLPFLKAFVRTVENMNPYWVGYSEQVMRYTLAIASEIGYPERELSSLAVAAYFSNIGMYLLSEELMEKAGEYLPHEVEQMKLHAEIGALIAEIFLGDRETADMIRYHHERMDGLGYPEGLKGEEIPLGARMIAVVQTFLAKMSGRSYRPALDFEQALLHVQRAAGSQLDESLVSALLSWIEKKQSISRQNGLPLGRCYEVFSVPSEICGECPVYRGSTPYCWEEKENLCHFHGKSCDTCVIRTEYLSREKKRGGTGLKIVHDLKKEETNPRRTGMEKLKGVHRFSLFYGRGEAKRLGEYPLVVVEPLGQAKEALDELHQGGTLVIGYLSVMEVPNGHFSGRLSEEDFLHEEGRRLRNHRYENDLVDLRSSRWRDWLYQKMNFLKNTGYDGFFLDTIANVEFDELIPSGRGEQLEAAVNLMQEIRKRYPDMILIQNNGVNELIDRTKGEVDAVCWENPPYAGWERNPWLRQMIRKLSHIRRREQIEILVLMETEGGMPTQEMLSFRSSCEKQGFLFTAVQKGYASSPLEMLPHE